MKKDSGIYLNMLKKYAENLSHYWKGIIERDENLSLQITIYPLVADNFGAVEFNFINGKCENKAYEIKNKSHLIYSKYDIGEVTNDFIYFGERSFLVIRPLRYSHWTKKQSKLDNSRLIHEIIMGSLQES